MSEVEELMNISIEVNTPIELIKITNVKIIGEFLEEIVKDIKDDKREIWEDKIERLISQYKMDKIFLWMIILSRKIKYW